jgi:tetratricopeptide (TPR) repeat protein
MNIEAYPRSANVYDSLSDGYLAMGNKDEALKHAEKAIHQALDKDTNATAEFKQLLRESAAKKIKELRPSVSKARQTVDRVLVPVAGARAAGAGRMRLTQVTSAP